MNAAAEGLSLHTYLIRQADDHASIHTQRWLGDTLRLHYRGPAVPAELAQLVVDDACTALSTTDDERAAAAAELETRLGRYVEIHAAEITDLVRPGLQPAAVEARTDREPGERYRLGIDDGQPGDCWFELGWDHELGSFVGLEWTRGPSGQQLGLPEQWHGTRAGELPTVTDLNNALGLTIVPELRAELDADRSAFPALKAAHRTPGLDDALADLIDLDGPDADADWPRYQVTFDHDVAHVDRIDWDGADPIHLGNGRWSDATIESRIAADRNDPLYPPVGDRPSWFRLNDPDQHGSWRLAYNPRRDGFVACHVDETGEPVTDRRIGDTGEPITVTPDLEAAIGRPLPAELAASLRVDRNAFMPEPTIDPSLGIDI